MSPAFFLSGVGLNLLGMAVAIFHAALPVKVSGSGAVCPRSPVQVPSSASFLQQAAIVRISAATTIIRMPLDLP